MPVIVIDNFASSEDSSLIYNRSNEELKKSFGFTKGFRESFVNLPPIKNVSDDQLLQIIRDHKINNTSDNIKACRYICETLYDIKDEIESFYKVKIETVESSLVKMLVGAKNKIHSDMYLLDGSEWHGGYGNRSSFKYSSILYFSSHGDHFVGGEVRFPGQDLLVQPMSGRLVHFSGDLDHRHSVSEIVSGERLALVAFFKPLDLC